MDSNCYVKPFLSYEDQLKLLKDRGLIVDDDSYALQKLRSENYYRLSGYWLNRVIKGNNGVDDHFIPGTNFNDIIDVYSFDEDLRSLILSITSKIEIELKAAVAHYHADKYGPLGYINNSNFEDFWYHSIMISSLNNDISRQKNFEFVAHYVHDRNRLLPLWVATELFTFDQISKFYKNMISEDRLQIARTYYHIPSREYVESWLECAVIMRNTAAHRDRFYYRSILGPAAKLPKNLSTYQKSLLGYIYALYALIDSKSRYVLLSGFEKCLSDHPAVKLEHIGFPENWKELIITSVYKES